MTRHFFALLALLTGLAALGSPAQASLAEAMACDSSIAALAGGDEAARSEAVRTRAPAATAPTRRAVQQPCAGHEMLPAPVRVPVLMGIERAYE